MNICIESERKNRKNHQKSSKKTESPIYENILFVSCHKLCSFSLRIFFFGLWFHTKSPKYHQKIIVYSLVSANGALTMLSVANFRVSVLRRWKKGDKPHKNTSIIQKCYINRYQILLFLKWCYILCLFLGQKPIRTQMYFNVF